MKKAVFIIAGPVALLLVLMAVFWFYLGRQTTPLSKPPEHGVCFTIRTEQSAAESPQAIAELKDTISRRFYHFGARIFWQPVSQSEFRVYAPIVEPGAVEKAAALAWQQGRLELRLVHINNRELISQGVTPEGYELLKQKISRPFNTNYYESFLVSRKPEGSPTGIRIWQAMAMQARMTGQYEIGFKLTPDSTGAFKDITRTNIGRQLAIVMDGALLSAPVIRSEISGGSGVISGNFDRAEAVQLASLLQTPLPVPVKLLDTKRF